jgi:ABC-type uncharacterized transport system permease subunit
MSGNSPPSGDERSVTSRLQHFLEIIIPSFLTFRIPVSRCVNERHTAFISASSRRLITISLTTCRAELQRFVEDESG